jgi:hypothetical protein
MSLKPTVVLFLDFDGVLHYFWPEPDATDEENSYFYFIPAFESVIRNFMNDIDITIIISSSWRDKRNYDQLKQPFSIDIRKLIKGVTPCHYDNSDGSRLKECEEWLSTNHYNKAWFALDDHPDIWNSHPNLIFCQNGFKEHEVSALTAKLSKLIN